MPRPLRLLLGLLLLVALAACSTETPADPHRAEADLTPARSLLRCGVETAAADAARAASRAWLEAVRADPTLLASGELIVAYDDAPRAGAGLRRTATAPTAVRAEHGLTLRRALGGARELVAAPDPLAAAERLLDDPRVRYAHPNLRLVPHAAPSDPDYDLQWNLASFGLEAAWDREVGAADVTIAVIDTGIDLRHPEFAGRLLPGWDFHDDDANVMTTAVHGTHVAGIAAASGGNGVGIAGVAQRAVRVLPIKVFDDYGASADVAAVADAIRWAAGLDVRGPDGRGPAPLEEPARIVNLSLGTAGGYLPVPDLDAAVRDARREGVLVVASVGNEGTQLGVTSPANGACAVAVGSVDETLARSSFSNRDLAERRVDVAAPAGFSLHNEAVYSTASGGRYAWLNGTSMAAPYVAGAAALLWSAHPDWTAEQVLERLLRTALLPAGADPLDLGFGIVCIDAALGADGRCGRAAPR